MTVCSSMIETLGNIENNFLRRVSYDLMNYDKTKLAKQKEALFIYISRMYGSLYVTLCFVLWRFDFGVLTFYFHILSFLFCVLCTMLFILNGAIHDLQTIYGRKDGRKRSCKYLNAFIVHVMLVGFFYI